MLTIIFCLKAKDFREVQERLLHLLRCTMNQWNTTRVETTLLCVNMVAIFKKW